MKYNDLLGKETYLFGNLFYLANKLQVVIDQDFAQYDLTTKQWYLMIVLGEFFKTPPTLKVLASKMGTSHQNAKQLALKLEKKGFLTLKKDSSDGRALRVEMTSYCQSFWEKRSEIDVNFFEKLFKDFSLDEVDQLFVLLKKLTCSVENLD